MKHTLTKPTSNLSAHMKPIVHFSFPSFCSLLMVGTLVAAEPNADVPFKVEDIGVFFDDRLMHLFDVWCVDAPMPVMRMGPNDAWIYLSHPAHPHKQRPDGPHAWITRVRCAITERGPVVDVFDSEVTIRRGIQHAGPGRRGWCGWMMHHYVIGLRLCSIEEAPEGYCT